jgi:aconitate hydratase
LSDEEGRGAKLEKTPLIDSIPELDVIPDEIAVPVLLKVGDDISTDDIMPAGARVMPFWSNIPMTSEFTFEPVDDTYPRRARENRVGDGHVIVAGNNYGQGSSRENAALAPRYLGLRTVLARSFARIHWQNLVNFGVLPLTFADLADYDRLKVGDMIRLSGTKEVRSL